MSEDSPGQSATLGSAATPTICLAMIVRDEAHVLRRCLESVAPVVDRWIVVDTGSTDATREVARQCLDAVPGRLIERPWVSFAHNRTEAFDLARDEADYVLVIDADETLHVEEGFTSAGLTADAYNVESRYGGLSYARAQLLKSSASWRWAGVVHEYPVCPYVSGPPPLIEGLWVEVRHDGARAREPKTYRRDALLLEEALLEQPDDPRTTFYLAQSYRDAGDFELAQRHYRARTRLGGWQDEVWYSLYQLARLREAARVPTGSVVEDYLAAYRADPTRAEPLYRIGARYAASGADEIARLFLAPALEIPPPDCRRLFVERDVYEYLLPLAFAEVSGRLGDHDRAIGVCNELLARPLSAERLGEVQRCRRENAARRAVVSPEPAPLSRIRVCVPVTADDRDVAECLESIALLDPAPYDVWLIADGSEPADLDPTLAGETRVHVVAHEQAPGFDGCIERFVTEHSEPSDIVVPLTPAIRFAGRGVLRAVAAAFADPGCQVLVGQHRRADGRLGDARPPVDEADLIEHGRECASRSPVIFRAGLLAEPGVSAPVLDRVLRTAGLGASRFTDEVLTACNWHGRVLAPRTETPAASEAPSVSCLMVTHDRLALAKRAIAGFARQSYENRELVIVSDGSDAALRALARFVVEMEVPNVELVAVEEQDQPLGALRNRALTAASGKVLCQWDDDDCFHPDRIAVQLRHLREHDAHACLLTDHLQFLEDDRALVWVDWTLAGRSGRDQLLPGTIMMRNDDRFRYPEDGPFARRGEDTMFLYALCDEVPVVPLHGAGHLYLYTFHGRNTFDRQHHHGLARCSITAAELEGRRDVVLSAMRNYPVPRPYAVIGRDGPAFTVNE